jgi:hypothetical protein
LSNGKPKATRIAKPGDGHALQSHRDAILIVDEDAAAGLTQREYDEFLDAAKPAERA